MVGGFCFKFFAFTQVYVSQNLTFEKLSVFPEILTDNILCITDLLVDLSIRNVIPCTVRVVLTRFVIIYKVTKLVRKGANFVDLSLFPLNICKFLPIIIQSSFVIVFWTLVISVSIRASISSLNNFCQRIFLQTFTRSKSQQNNNRQSFPTSSTDLLGNMESME